MSTGKITDFGVKIGGARKDLRGTMTQEDIEAMTPEEIQRHVTKNMIWPAPDYEAWVTSGQFDQKSAALVKMLRDSIPPAPTYTPSSTDAERKAAAQAYLSIVATVSRCIPEKVNENELPEHLRAHPALSELFSLRHEEHPTTGRLPWVPLSKPTTGSSFSKAFVNAREAMNEVAHGVYLGINGRVDDAMRRMLRRNPDWPQLNTRSAILVRKQGYGMGPSLKGDGYSLSHHDRLVRTESDLARYAKREGYETLVGRVFASKEEGMGALLELAEAKVAETSRAVKMKRDALKARALGVELGDGTVASFSRVGPDYRAGQHVEGPDYLKEFGLRGGEFGLWVSQDERQDVLDRGFDSFRDIAAAFSLESANISLGGTLAIAFGARGRGGHAAAHYEPDRKVINLTKPSGEGCLAHEWGHALDHYLYVEARQMGLVKGTTNQEFPTLLSNAQLTPRGTALGEKERAIRSMHAFMAEIAETSEPLTKAEMLEMATRRKEKLIGTIGDHVVRIQEQLGQNTVPDAKARQVEVGEAFALLRTAASEVQRGVLVETLAVISKAGMVEKTARALTLDALKLQAAEAISEQVTLAAQPDDWKAPPARRRTEYSKKCRELDNERTSPYYSLNHEMFARAFEAVAVDQLQAQGVRNYFLVAACKGEAFPHGVERQRLGAKLPGLMAQIRAFMPEVKTQPIDFKARNIVTERVAVGLAPQDPDMLARSAAPLPTEQTPSPAPSPSPAASSDYKPQLNLPPRPKPEQFQQLEFFS